ncbi:MAG TPA: response regulator [Xanthobacteraceae bacterium]|nr:response regulator [Xanthobacteraceae bacterium]
MHLPPIRMLVADASDSVQAFFQDVAERSRIRIAITPARSGPECLALLTEGHFNLAFIDINMPEMSGMEALGRARAAGNKIFAVLMSGKVTDERLDLARQLKTYEYLVKPFTAADVTSILKAHQQVMVPIATLIVDDSRTIRRVIRQVLEDAVFKLSIEEAVDGESALKRFKDGGYDIVFLDYAMPGLNGIETLDAIRAREPKAKVIMISAMPDATIERQALDHGAIAFLPKPFFWVDVSRAVHGALGLKMPSLTANWSPDRNMKKRLEVCPADDEDTAADGKDRAISWA